MSRPESRPTIPISTPLECPTGVPDDIRAEFEHLRGLLGARLHAENCHLLLMLATAWTTWRGAQADVARDGRIVMSGGTAIGHPALAIAHQAYGQIVTLSRELGISPASRKRGTS